jgi:2,3-bisphosphoglycerate-independent phosphoglycerate mutase
VPVSICGPALKPDAVLIYDEVACLKGALGLMKGDQLMRRLFGL